jgi:hypothetical protein
VAEEQRFPPREIRLDLLLVDPRLLGIRQRHHYDIRAADRLRSGNHLKPVVLRHRNRFAARVKPDDDPDPAVTQVERVRVPL